MCYFSRLFVIQLKIKIPQTNNCNFDFYVTLNFIEYILWIKHKPQIKYQYILLVDSTFYCILFFDSSDCRNNTFKHQFVCRLSVSICSVQFDGHIQEVKDWTCRSSIQVNAKITSLIKNVKIRKFFLSQSCILKIKCLKFEVIFRMKSSFLPKYEQKMSRFLPSLHKAEILTIFRSYFGRNDDFINSF